MDLTVHSTDIWWNMLNRFSKQVWNKFPKIILKNVNSKPCQTVVMEFFPQVFTYFRDKLRILPHI